MYIGPYQIEDCDRMSVTTAPTVPRHGFDGRRRTRYPLRRLARLFAVIGATTVVYASALMAIAIETAIIEF
ncbi:MAG: hypothetical protein ACE5GT_07580 [Rhodospirillales bacterium]